MISTVLNRSISSELTFKDTSNSAIKSWWVSFSSKIAFINRWWQLRRINWKFSFCLILYSSINGWTALTNFYKPKFKNSGFDMVMNPSCNAIKKEKYVTPIGGILRADLMWTRRIFFRQNITQTRINNNAIFVMVVYVNNVNSRTARYRDDEASGMPKVISLGDWFVNGNKKP